MTRPGEEGGSPKKNRIAPEVGPTSPLGVPEVRPATPAAVGRA